MYMHMHMCTHNIQRNAHIRSHSYASPHASRAVSWPTVGHAESTPSWACRFRLGAETYSTTLFNKKSYSSLPL